MRMALKNCVANRVGLGQPSARSRLPHRSFVRRLNESLELGGPEIPRLRSE